MLDRLLEIGDMPSGSHQQEEMSYRLGFVQNEERDKRARREKLIGAVRLFVQPEARLRVVAVVAPTTTEEDAHARLADGRARQIGEFALKGQVTDVTEVTPPPAAGDHARAVSMTITPSEGASRRVLQVWWAEPGQALLVAIVVIAPAILDVSELTSGLVQRQRERLAQVALP